jgi:DNA-binding transcriptional LysR family regulator
MALNVTHLRSFLAVARAGGVSAAARRLNVAQPALTRQIRELEAGYGITLFERGAAGTRLTEEGAVLVDHVARVFDGLTQVEFLLTSLGRRALRIGSVSTRSLSTLLNLLHAAFPDVETSIQIGTYVQVLDGVRSLRFDLGVLTIDHDHDELQIMQIERAPFLILLPVDDPLARRGAAVPLGTLAGRSLLMKPGNSRSRQVFDAILAEAGITPGTVRDVSAPEMIAELVSCGLGTGVVALSTDMRRPDVVALPFTGGIDIPVHVISQPSGQQTRSAQRAWAELARHLAGPR